VRSRRQANVVLVGAEWHGSVTSTWLVRPVDTFSQRLSWARPSAARCSRRACWRAAAILSPSTLAACAAMRLSSRLQRVPASPIRHAVRGRAPKRGHPKSAIIFASILVGCSLIA
jgi:hypothetical protein